MRVNSVLIALVFVPEAVAFRLWQSTNRYPARANRLHASALRETTSPVTTPVRANLAVRELFHRITLRLGEDCDWTRTRNYLYGASDKLSIDQVDSVLDFLTREFSDETARIVLQQAPRILRKNCKNNLQPTLQLLNDLFGSDLVATAVARNPNLLLTRGAGYESDPMELVESFLTNDLGIKPSGIKKVKETLPSVFQTQVSKLLSITHFFRGYLEHAISPDKVNIAIGKLFVAHPQVFLLSVEKGLEPRIQFLKNRCEMDDKEIGSLLASSSAGGILGLSVEENLKPTLDYLSERLDRQSLRKTVKSHPQILGLSLSNIQEKVAFFDSIDEDIQDCADIMRLRSSLASRILSRATSVFSLSLDTNIRPKVNFLANIWGCSLPAPRNETEPSTDLSPKLAEQLGQYPNVLSLSLEGNLQPTADFFNRTGYIAIDSEWKLVQSKDDATSHTILRGRDLAASLSNRLLPRWHFVTSKLLLSEEEKRIPLHILVSANDRAFCEAMSLHLDEYEIFKRESVPRLRFSSQFDTWIKTGRPIDV